MRRHNELGPYWEGDPPADTVRPELIERTLDAWYKDRTQSMDHLTTAEMAAMNERVKNDPREPKPYS